MLRNAHSFKAVVLAGACTFVLSSALAQSVDLAADSAETPLAVGPVEAGSVEDAPARQQTIIVTAQKRSESLQEVPASITAIGDIDLQRRDLDSIQSLVTQIPNLSFGAITGTTYVSVRGVGTSVNSGIAEPSVAVYVDGAYLARATMANIGLNDLERIEVLRGPQGTLYGRNATGGAINFVSKKPTADFEAGWSAKAGNFNQLAAKAYLSGPISEQLYFRVAGAIEKRDGYTKNIQSGQDLSNADDWFGKVALRWLPTSDLTFDLSAQYFEDNANNSYHELLSVMPPGVVPDGARASYQPRRVFGDLNTDMYLKTFVASGVADWSITDSVSLKSITSYVRHRTFGTFDADTTDYGLVNLEDSRRGSRTLTQEFNLTGNWGNLDWLVGAFYFDEDFTFSQPVVLPNGLPGALPPGSVIFTGQSEETRSYAVFGDFTYSLSDRLRLLAGIRYNQEEKDALQTNTVIIPGVGTVGVVGFPGSIDDQKVLPKFGVQYDLSDDVLLYAQYQEGLKSGGFSTSAPGDKYDAENIKAYEIGLKSEFFDGRAVINAAAFFYKYSNYQQVRIDPPTTQAVENADAENKGAEIEISLRPAEDWRINLAASYLDAKYTEFQSADAFDPAAGLQDLRGNYLNRTPKYTLQAGVEKHVPLQAGFISNLVVRADAFHTDKYYFRPFNLSQDVQPAYTTLSGSISLEGDNFDVRFFVSNATDELVKAEALYSALQETFVGLYTPPRTYGVELSYRY